MFYRETHTYTKFRAQQRRLIAYQSSKANVVPHMGWQRGVKLLYRQVALQKKTDNLES